MPLVKYVFKPGINKEGTNYSNENGWFDADKVRFRKGRPERIGGWVKHSSDSFIGTSRKLHTYSNISGSIFTVVSDRKIGPLFVSIKLVAAILETPSCIPKV